MFYSLNFFRCCGFVDTTMEKLLILQVYCKNTLETYGNTACMCYYPY